MKYGSKVNQVNSRSVKVPTGMGTGKVSEAAARSVDWSASFSIIVVLTFLIPILVLPRFLENAFDAPKNFLMIVGSFLLLGIHALKYLRGSQIAILRASTNFTLAFLVLLNISSFFYTGNYYYTVVAASIQIACLLLFCFISIHVDSRQAFRLLIVSAASVFLVSLETWLQFYNVFVLFPWAHPGINVMGTVGNSNYLGAYLMFGLFVASGLFFLVEGRYRFVIAGLFVFIFAAFVFSRARASWLGFFVGFPILLILLKGIFSFSVVEYVRSRRKQVVICCLGAVALFGILWSVAPKRLHEMLKWEQVGQSLTFKLRTEKYSQASLWLFKQNPLFGTGLGSYRNMVYNAQAEINKSDPAFFKNYPEPKPRRVHNEYLETLNDGGLLAAVALVLFLVVVMSHGWKVIRNESLERRGRIISATAFSSIVAVLTAALFFFPFRVNTTLFMTVLMLGIMEGLYLRNYHLLSTTASSLSPGIRRVLISFMIFFLGGLVWFTAVKPFMGEVEQFKYKNALAAGKPKEAETHLLRALEYDPRNTAYCTSAAQFYMGPLPDLGNARDFIERAIVDFNGDITLYSLHFLKGVLKFQMGSLYEARDAFEKALYYYPEFTDARQKLEEVKKVIKDHDQVLIKFR